MPRPRGQPASAGAPTVVYSRVGNPGCIRFPEPVRRASGIRRNDDLLVTVLGPGAIRVERPPAGAPLPPAGQRLALDRCGCPLAPAGCAGEGGSAPVARVTVGWSYIQIDRATAASLGLVADRPIRLTARPAVVDVEVAGELPDGELPPSVRCPP